MAENIETVRDDAAQVALRAAAAHGLPGVRLLGPADDRSRVTTDVIELAVQHRIQGLLWSAIDGGAVAADDAMAQAASESAAAALRTCLVAEQTAVLAVQAIRGAGAEARALKGIAIAHLDHVDPAERVFGDCDLLIRRADYRPALAALTSAGFRRAEPPVRGWWEQRFGKAIVLYGPSGAELDLHVAITGGYFGTMIDHDDLWSRASEPFQLAGLPVQGLDREGRLLQAACHTMLGGGSGLRAERDVAQLVLVSGADWELAVERAERDGVELVLAAAVRKVWADLGLDLDHGFARWSAAHRPDPRQERALAGYGPSSEGWATEGRTVLPALSPADRLLFLAGLAVPSRANLRSRGRLRREHVSRFRLLRRWRATRDPDLR